MNNLAIADKIELSLEDNFQKPALMLVSNRKEKLSSRNFFNAAMAEAQSKFPQSEVKLHVSGRKELSIEILREGKVLMEWDNIILCDENMAKRFVTNVLGYMRTIH